MITALVAVAGLLGGLVLLARRHDGAFVVVWGRVLSGLADRVVRERESAAAAAAAALAFTEARVSELRRQGRLAGAAELQAERDRYLAAATENRRLTRVLRRLIRAHRTR